MKKDNVIINQDQYKEQIKNYFLLNQEKKKIESQLDLMKKELKEYTNSIGIRDENTGSCSVDLGNFLVENRCKTKIDISKEALILKYQNSPELLQKMIRFEVEVNKEGIDELLSEGKITEEDIKGLLVVSEPNYSFYVTKAKEEKGQEEEFVKASKLIKRSIKKEVV